MQFSEQMNLLYVTLGVARGNYFDKLQDVEMSKLNASLILTNNSFEFVNSVAFSDEIKAILNEIDNKISAEILRRNQAVGVKK